MGFTSGNSLRTYAALLLAVPRGPSLAKKFIMLLSDTALVTSLTNISSMSAYLLNTALTKVAVKVYEFDKAVL